MTCCRGGAGAPGQPPARPAHPLLRVDGHEDLRLLAPRQGGAHHPRDRGQEEQNTLVQLQQ